MAGPRKGLGKAPGFRAGIDIGGTFTDVVVATEDGRLAVRKCLSTPDDYGRAGIESLVAALAELGIEAGTPAEVVHATTVATNAILEHRGADCALITTEGFRDVLEIGRLRVPQLYNLFHDKRRMLLPRRHIFEVRERVDALGQVVTALDSKSVDSAVEGVVKAGVDSVAVCLINGHANGTHERAIAAALAAAAPDLDISVSSETLPRIGEYERTSTTVIDAYVKPVVRRYLDSLQDRLRTARIPGPLFAMQCGGGLTTAKHAATQPVTLIESGPAAGVLAAVGIVADSGHRNLLTFDMGGTTAKASIIEDGEALRTTDFEVGGVISSTSRLTGGDGYPINVPVIDVAEVGAGGGSIAWIDDGGSLRVGPRSAGANPGPACYGQGGLEPTVTDANVILGYLNPDAIAGGAIAIDPGLAERALRDRIADPLGMDLVDAAYGVHLIANSEMMGAIRAVSTQRGRDVRDFALVAFGGCGPIHAVDLARTVGIGTVIVPQSPGLFSAFGLLTTDLEFQRASNFYTDVEALETGNLNARLNELRLLVVATASHEAIKDVALDFEIEADFHYWGQSHELTVRFPFREVTKTVLADLIERFEAEHERTYGHRAQGERVILVAARVIGRAPSSLAARRGSLQARTTADGRVAGERHRRAYFGAEIGFRRAALIGRHDLNQEPRPGPLVIEEYDSVTIVPPGSDARLDAAGFIVVSVPAPGETRTSGKAASMPKSNRRESGLGGSGQGGSSQGGSSQGGSSLSPDIDPVKFELIRNSMSFLVNEMGLTLVRTSYSGILRDNMDFSTGIADINGEMVAQGLSVPMQFGTMPDAVAAVQAYWSGRMEPGDIFVLNDPFEGGTHLPDVFFIKPVFFEGEPLCFVCISGHQVDVGGRIAGSNACDSREVYAEGLRIPPLKLFERGEPNETLFRLIEKNVRVPVKLLGDFRAQISGLRTGEDGVGELIARHGVETTKRYWAELLDHAERMTRVAILELPDGDYEFTDYLDSDGIEARPVAIKVKLMIDGDSIVTDFTGSSPQVQGAINSTLSMTKSISYGTVRSVLRADIPNNGGFFRPIRLIVEKGSILDCNLPAASAGRGVTLFRQADTVYGALAQAVPDRVFAACEGGTTVYGFGGHDDQGRPIVLVEIFGGSWGGRPDRDGIEGMSHPLLNQRNIPVEHMEVEYPLRVEKYGFQPDTGGAGQYRGGLSLVRDIRYLGATPAQLQIRSDRVKTMPYGLAGGAPGTPSRNILNPGTKDERQLAAMVTTMIEPGEVIRFLLPGGGGWGPAGERDPAAIARDVADGKLTPAYVREHYGLVVDHAGRIDHAAEPAR